MPAAWSSADAAFSLIRDAQTLQSRAWIAAYLLSRRGPGPVRRLATPAAHRTASLSMAGLSHPLHVTADSGGLATYYEIITQQVYGGGDGLGVESGGTVVDVGANVGVFSMAASDSVGPGGEVVSIEPHPLAFRILSQNLAPIGWSRQFNVGCGDAPADMRLHYVPGRLSVSSVRERPDRTESVRMIVRPLDDILDEVGVESVHLLKVDVEGFEHAVLRGADRALRRTRRLVIETDTRSIDEITSFVRERGLKLVGQVEGAWGLAAERVAAYER